MKLTTAAPILAQFLRPGHAGSSPGRRMKSAVAASTVASSSGAAFRPERIGNERDVERQRLQRVHDSTEHEQEHGAALRQSRPHRTTSSSDESSRRVCTWSSTKRVNSSPPR